jgi:putative copper export protein
MNDPTFWVNVVSRWLHVTAAVVGVGGIFFLLVAVLPALRSGDHAAAADAIRQRYKPWAHGAIGLLLLTGFYNYLWVAVPKLRAETFRGAYHGAMGVKIILAFAIFAIAILLLKPVPSFHENRRMWLTVNALLALVVLLIGAYLRRLWAGG